MLLRVVYVAFIAALIVSGWPASALYKHANPHKSPLLIAEAPSKAASKANDRGVDLYNAGKYRQAIDAYDQAIKLNPKLTEAYSNRGAAYDALNDSERAVADYSMAIQLDPKLVAAFANRAAAYIDAGENEKAIEDCNMVIKLSPRDYQAYNKRGCAYQALGNNQAALKDFDKAVSLKPNFQKAKQNRDLLKKALSISIGSTDKTPAKTTAGQTTVGAEHAPPAHDESSGTPPRELTDESATNETLPKALTDESGFNQTPDKIGSESVSKPAAPNGATATKQPSGQRQIIALPKTDGGLSLFCAYGGMRYMSFVPLDSLFTNIFHQTLGNICYTAQQWQPAADEYGAAIAANNYDPFAYFRRGNSYCRMGRLADAFMDFDQAIALNPHFGQALRKRQYVQSLILQQGGQVPVPQAAQQSQASTDAAKDGDHE